MEKVHSFLNFGKIPVISSSILPCSLTFSHNSPAFPETPVTRVQSHTVHASQGCSCLCSCPYLHLQPHSSLPLSRSAYFNFRHLIVNSRRSCQFFTSSVSQFITAMFYENFLNTYMLHADSILCTALGRFVLVLQVIEVFPASFNTCSFTEHCFNFDKIYADINVSNLECTAEWC